MINSSVRNHFVAVFILECRGIGFLNDNSILVCFWWCQWKTVCVKSTLSPFTLRFLQAVAFTMGMSCSKDHISSRWDTFLITFWSIKTFSNTDSSFLAQIIWLKINWASNNGEITYKFSIFYACNSVYVSVPIWFYWFLVWDESRENRISLITEQKLIKNQSN